MDDVPEGEDDETRTDLPVTRRDAGGAVTGPATDRVKIVGAEPAGEVTGELPVVRDEVEPQSDDGGDPEMAMPGQSLFDQPSVHVTDQPADPGESVTVVEPVRPGETAVPSGSAPPTELPHWTEPPTGQVPAVLSRDTGDEPTNPGIVAPTWREEDADWVAHDEEFEPAMFADDEVALGSLDETDDTAPERRPWEFDLNSGSASATGQTRKVAPRSDQDAPAVPEPVTGAKQPGGPDPASPAPARAVEAEPRRTGGPDDRPEPTTVVPAVVAAAVAAESRSGAADRTLPVTPDRGVDDEASIKPVPTGTTRVGRARRAGLLPARMRAKRPEDVEVPIEPPLAAVPPGASVTDVPGAGRKKVGVAGLAAADRTAERAADQSPGPTDPGSGPEAAELTAAAASGTGWRRRLLRRTETPDPSPAPGTTDPAPPTGGGPPVRRRPRPKTDDPARPGGSSIGIRVGTGIAVAVVALLAFKLGTVPSLVLSAVVVTFAAGECFGVLRGAGYHPASLLGLVGTVSLMVGAYTKGVAALPLVLVLITVFTLIWYLFGIEQGSPVAGTAATLLTVGWVSLLGAYAGLLLSPSAFPDRHGIAFLLGAIIATVANDVGALVIGGWLGSRPLAPRISPNKTWEGLFGGAVFSILFSTVVVGSIHPWSASNAALLGVVVAVVAPIGDLCESLLKRDLGLKDMGRLLPGHGGVLDRVDALLFVLPATYYLVRALNIA